MLKSALCKFRMLPPEWTDAFLGSESCEGVNGQWDDFWAIVFRETTHSEMLSYSFMILGL